jgi:Periplasmic binding protein
MDRRSVVIVGAVSLALLVAIGLGIALTTGGSGNQSVRTSPGSVTTLPIPATLPTTSSTKPVITAPANTVPTPPKPTVVIGPSPTTAAPGPTPTTRPSGGNDTGITDREIRLTAIADSAPVLRGVEAWALALNRAGGLAKRTVHVDSRLVATPADYSAAVSSACATSFAIVGSSSTFDSQSAGLQCGIPEIATRLFDPAHQSLRNAYAVIPTRSGLERVGAFKRLLSTVSGCCRQYVLVPTGEPGRTATMRSLQAAATIGFTTAATPDVSPTATPADYTAIVADLVAKQATFARSGLGATSTVQLRKAAAANSGSRTVKAWYCDASCDDATFLASGGTAVEGQLIDVGVNPLVDQHAIPAMATFLRAMRHIGATPSVPAVESYSAGALFEQAARQVIQASGNNGLTRVRLLGAVATVHAFNAGGMLGDTDVGARQPNGCFMLLTVTNGHFVRSFPTAPGQLDCGAQNLQMGS